MILSSTDIERLIREGRLKIEPLGEDTVRENGLDLRFSGEYALAREGLFRPGESDPEDFFDMGSSDELILRRGVLTLISTMEYVSLPEDVVGLIEIRSSYARLGVFIAPTVVDAGYEGRLTVALYPTNLDVVLRRGERILHLVLLRAATPSDRPYRGRYRGLKSLALPFTRRRPR